jgi:hypothetical protein
MKYEDIHFLVAEECNGNDFFVSRDQFMMYINDLKQENSDLLNQVANQQRMACSLSFKGSNNVSKSCRKIVLDTPLIIEDVI